jgi:hypothetical protein
MLFWFVLLILLLLLSAASVRWTVARPTVGLRWGAIAGTMALWGAAFWLWGNCEAIDLHFGDFYPC